jgi:hypothetical protein
LAIATILTTYISAVTLSNQAFAQRGELGQTLAQQSAQLGKVLTGEEAQVGKILSEHQTQLDKIPKIVDIGPTMRVFRFINYR